MVLISWWMILVWIAFGIVVFALGSRRRKALKMIAVANTKLTKKVAHSKRIQKTASFVKVMRRYKLLLTAAIVSAGISFIMLFGLTLRPASLVVEQPDLTNRDIMLCLDISGSMQDTDKLLLKTFSSIAKDLKGERIGLTVFDSSAKSVFPLTDDYDFVASQLKAAYESFDGKSGSYADRIYAGTSEGEGSSLIGDGLGSCLLRFDGKNTKRSRSVILATDNFTNGKQIVTFPQATTLAREKSVRVYGINPNDFSNGKYNNGYNNSAKEFHDEVLRTGGAYFRIDYDKRTDVSVVGKIVESIASQEATRFKGAPQIVQTDIPAPFLITAGLATFTLMLLLWRLKI